MELPFGTIVKLSRHITSIVITCLASVSSAEQAYISYRVGPGETLSSILYDKFHLSPVYGRAGYIVQTIRLNSGHPLKAADQIRDGDVILIPADSSEITAYGPPADSVRAPAADEIAVAASKIEPVVQPPAPAPSLVPAPVPAPAPPAPIAPATLEVRHGFEPHSQIDVSAGAHYRGLFGVETSNNTTAHLLSTLSPSLHLGWVQIWDPDFSSEIFIGFESIRFTPDVHGTALTNASVLNDEFGIRFARRLAERFSLGLSLGYVESLFYTGSNSSGLVLDQIPLLRVHPELEFDVYKLKPFTLSLLAGTSFYGGSTYDNYDIANGFGFDGALRISQAFVNSLFRCELGYGERRQNTSYLNLVEKDVFTSCGYQWGF